jgi:hypothetical protein
MFALLKGWKILQWKRVESIETMEMELDAVVSLHNMMRRDFEKGLSAIPDRALRPPRSQIMTKDLEPNLKIPTPIKLNNANFPPHWKLFRERMTDILPGLQQVLKGEGEEACFSQRVLKRGENLFAGGNVSQIQCQVLDNDVLRVKSKVYASMKSPVYDCYFEMQKGVVLVRTACMCKNG